MDIKEKYKQTRSIIKNGDIILFRGNNILSKIIQKCDHNAYYNHSGIVFKKFGRLFILDSNQHGVHPDFLSARMEKYIDFFIISPKYAEKDINEALSNLFKQSEDGIKYDFSLLLKIAIYRKLFKVNKFKKDNYKNKDICSEFVRRYLKILGITSYDYLKTEWITPQDILRYYDKNKMELKFNDSII